MSQISITIPNILANLGSYSRACFPTPDYYEGRLSVVAWTGRITQRRLGTKRR